MYNEIGGSASVQTVVKECVGLTGLTKLIASVGSADGVSTIFRADATDVRVVAAARTAFPL